MDNFKMDGEFEKKQMGFMLNSLSDTIEKYDNRFNTDELSIMRSDDAAVSLDAKNVIPFESLLTSKFTHENENTVKDNDFEVRFQEDFKRREEMRHLGFESEVMDIHNRYIEENGYDAFVEQQREIAYARYNRMSESELEDFDDKFPDLDEYLAKHNDSELKL